jgi:hypothetical protein
MRTIVAFVALAASAMPIDASASWFEFCRIEGRVSSAKVVPADRAQTFELNVEVFAAQPDETVGLKSYTDCSEHMGQSLSITLRIPRKYGQPKSGDSIVFTRSVADLIDPKTGVEGTWIQVKLLSYATES